MHLNTMNESQTNICSDKKVSASSQSFFSINS